MTGLQVMVVLIVAMVMIASIIKGRQGRKAGGPASIAGTREYAQLKDEVERLHQRLAVLERITVEKENTLERQIEELRDR